MDRNLYDIALVAHIAGITIMAGATFIDFMAFRQFRMVYPNEKAKGFVIGEMLFRLQKLIGIGMLVILISGVFMMFYMHQVWGQQIWFRIKMGILLLIIINGLIIRRRLGSRLKNLLAGGSADRDFTTKLSRIKSNMTKVHIFQILFFVTIFVLSVFKFN